MVSSYKAAPDIEVLTSSFAVPGYGLVPINAFVIKGSEPILVDTGTVIETGDFMPALRTVIDPADLKWIWLTHTDFDHIGSLHQLLAENPQIRVITTFLGVGIMSLSRPAADGPGLSRQPRPEDQRGRPHAHRLQAPRVRQSLHHGLLRRQVGSASSAPTASGRSYPQRLPRAQPTSPTRTCAKASSSGQFWTRRGCTRWTRPPSQRSSTPSARWLPKWS